MALELSTSFTFAQVAEALAFAHDIEPQRGSAFRYRLKHYQKQGWPKGLNTGRGVAASYDMSHVTQLALALELNELGLSPERAIWVLDSNRYLWGHPVSWAANYHRTGKGGPAFIAMDPSALDDLRCNDEYDGADATFHYFGIGTLREAVGDWSNGSVVRFSVINVTNAFYKIIDHLSLYADRDAMLSEMEQWAQEAVNGDS